MIAILHGSKKRPKRAQVVGVIPVANGEFGIAVNNIAIGPMLTKIVRGCHTILYGEYMSAETRNKILHPIPTINPKTLLPDSNNDLPQHEAVCKKLKNTARMSSVDRIVGFNGKFEYICCWAKSDDGKRVFNMFGMKVYNWEKLGDRILGRSQSCVGTYESPTGKIPTTESLAIMLDSPFRYREALNPFEIGYVP